MRIREKFPVISYKIGKILMVLSTLLYRKNPIKWTLKTYKKKYGKQLDLINPQSFYEKMNYWKHYSFNPVQTEMTDKLAVKEFLSNIGYGDLCAKCYYHSKNINDIKKWVKENASVYKRFVLKTNHGCGDIYIYDNGVITKKYGRKIKNLKQVYKMLKESLKYNFYYNKFERNYMEITPEIFIEEFIDLSKEAVEFELMCNYGEIKFANIVKNRQEKDSKSILIDSNFCGIEDKNIKIVPTHLDKIQKIIDNTCKIFPFCRADFIESGNKLYFCEFTFVKSGGINIYHPEELENYLGSLFRL